MKRFALLWVVLLTISSVYAAEQPKEGEAKGAESKKEAKAANPVVTIATSKGDIVVELYAKQAPITVANFLAYTEDGFYNGKIFHRVIPRFMIQGGGLTQEMVNKLSKKPIKNESTNKLRNKRGTIAMARKNPPDSATSQFFINHADNKALDFDGPYEPGYAVFGKVIKGMDVVDAIASVKTENSQYYDEEYKRKLPCQDVPVEQIIIKSVTVAKKHCDTKACAEGCTKDCEKCPKKESCTKACPKQAGAGCSKDGKCTKEGCECSKHKEGTCCKKESK